MDYYSIMEEQSAVIYLTKQQLTLFVDGWVLSVPHNGLQRTVLLSKKTLT